jgi:hypothetical protein
VGEGEEDVAVPDSGKRGGLGHVSRGAQAGMLILCISESATVLHRPELRSLCMRFIASGRCSFCLIIIKK